MPTSLQHQILPGRYFGRSYFAMRSRGLRVLHLLEICPKTKWQGNCQRAGESAGTAGKKFLRRLEIAKIVLASFLFFAVLGLAHADILNIETVSYQRCNTKPPLRCDSTASSTLVRVQFTEALDGSPTTSFVGNWTLVAANTVKSNVNSGMNSCSADACQPLITPLFLNTTIVRELIAYDLELVASGIPYGYILLSQTANGQNVSQLQNPNQLDANITCSGAAAPLSAKNVCSAGAPPITPSLVAEKMGAYPDTAFVNLLRWLPNSQRKQCNGVICYACPSGQPKLSTLFRTYGFGGTCQLFKISATSQQANFELDVFANLTTVSGQNLGAGLYFSSLMNFGSGGQLPDVQRTSFTRLARGWFEGLSVSAGDKTRLTSVSATIEGGYIMVCNADQSDVPLDQGFFNPYNSSKNNWVPTANGLGGNQSWFYLSANDVVALRGSYCGKLGYVSNLAPQLSKYNLTNACITGNVQAGLCVPGYSNNPNATNSTSLTPALIISRLNEYALAAAADPSTPVPAFLPPLWNPVNPPYYLRVLPNNYQLVYQPQSFDPIQVTGTYVMQFSNDVVIYGNQTKRVSVNYANTICTYWTARKTGALQFQVCNYGNDTSDTTFFLQVLRCTSDVVFTNSSMPSPPFTISLYNLQPGSCVYTPSIDIKSYSQPGNYTDFVPNTQIPLIGKCQFLVFDSSNSTTLVGSVSAPASLPCIARENPLRNVTAIPEATCNFWGDPCSDDDILVWISIAALLAGTLVIIATIFGCLIHYKADKKNNYSTVPSNY